jgi:hypothetical protein
MTAETAIMVANLMRGGRIGDILRTVKVDYAP